MEDKKKKTDKPDDHILEIQNGKIDIRMIIGRIDERIKQKMEARNGKISS